MPFSSIAQMKATFSGALGSRMKKKAPEFAAKTNTKSLPERAKDKKGFASSSLAKLAELKAKATKKK